MQNVERKTWYELLTLQDRIKDIDEKTNGDLDKYQVSKFHQQVFESLRKLSCGSQKQNKILNEIEIKVFGYARDKEEKKT